MKTPHNPALTTGELSRIKGCSPSTIYNRAKIVPLPQPLPIAKSFNLGRRALNRYDKYELLKWWDEVEAILGEKSKMR